MIYSPTDKRDDKPSCDNIRKWNINLMKKGIYGIISKKHSIKSTNLTVFYILYYGADRQYPTG
jgi:hypothetical protein